jgi:hypothetical protein
VFFSTREAAGASGARYSLLPLGVALRPPIEEDGMFKQNSRDMRGENAKLRLQDRLFENRIDAVEARRSGVLIPRSGHLAASRRMMRVLVAIL